MRVRRNRFTAGAVVVAAALVAAGCGAGASSSSTGLSPTGNPIVIGISLPLTGGFSADGIAFDQGYKLWQTEINSSGGLLGRPVKLIILNDNSDPNVTQTQYRTLITADHVDLTLGPFSSLLTIPAEAAVAPYGYAMIEGAGTADTVFGSAANLKYHNVISPSLPVRSYMNPLVAWIKSLPASQRPKTAAYPSVADPFALPAVQNAQSQLSKLGITTVYPVNQGFNEATTNNQDVAYYQGKAQAVARANPQLVVLGSTDVGTVAEFMTVFQKAGFKPEYFVATSGPDQGNAFISFPGVGPGNADGMMVPGGWSGTYSNADSYSMVEQYISRYGGTAAGVNADVAEAFSVGEVAADAVKATGGTDNAKILAYLHSGVTLQTVQGAAQFDTFGHNISPAQAAFMFQWQSTGHAFNQVLPVGIAGTVAGGPIVKPAWGS